MGEAAVRFMANFHQPQRQVLLQTVQHRAGAAVPGIDHHPEGFEDGQVHISQEMSYIVLERVGGQAGAGPDAGGEGRRGGGQGLDFFEAAVARRWAGSGGARI